PQGEFTGRVLVAAPGGLSVPTIPALPGLGDFKGKVMHSAEWDSGYALAGKRVAVIGTGASAIQIVPAIAPLASELKVFQRTPPWIQPRRDRPITALEKFLLRWAPPLQWLYRLAIFLQHEFRLVYFAHAKLMQFGHAAALKNMHAIIADPQLRAKLTPNYVMGCKRVLVSDDYYPALTRPNVELITTGIRTLTPTGIRTHDGGLHEVDCIVFGTGFQVTENPNNGIVHGRGGQSLVEAWRDSGEEAYLGTLVKNFPNLFLMVGPNAGTGHNSIVYVCEQQARFIVRLLRLMRARGATTLEVKPAVQDAFNTWAQDWFRNSVWGSGCKSWYQNRHGKVIAIWPGYSYQRGTG
ncbi:MAG: flavin-containing monooxygenase, partial [Pseudonocardiaceae bacterium]